MSDPLLRPAADVVARRLGDALVIVRLSTNQIYEMNATGARFWELIDLGTRTADAVAILADEFDASRDDIAGDIAALVRELASQGLIVTQ